jgi:hypothetical protein
VALSCLGHLGGIWLGTQQDRPVPPRLAAVRTSRAAAHSPPNPATLHIVQTVTHHVTHPTRAAEEDSAATPVAAALPPPAARTEDAGTPDPAQGKAERATDEASNLPAAGEDDTNYWPRKWLDEVPQAFDPVDLPYPDGAPLGRFSAVYTLFIDADGRVHQLRSESTPLPLPLDAAARQAFLGARFSPGVAQGVAVRSRIRIEIAYEAAPL